MTESIADVVLAALSDLKRLLETVRESDDLSLRTSLLPRLDDELARLKVWAGNSGAHRTGRASLEHRLRDASHIRQQVLRLLHDLKDSLEDAADIMNGKATPWEETEDDEEPLDDLETETEMEQIALDVTELVDCLLRLSVSIQNPAPHDRFMSSTFTDTSVFEEFDIQHVQAKFQDIDEGLAQRLGKAMSRRRQYFKYREAHHQKLSDGSDRHGDTNKTEPTLPAPSTLASSIPLQMKQEVPVDLSGDDTQSDGRASLTSFATSLSGPKTLKVPPMPEDALKGPFMCPFCYLIVSVQDTRAWKKHVFGDLRPYNCLDVHCTAPDREFSRRNEWMQHMLQNHLRVYRCPCGCPNSFSSAAESKGHLLRAHSGAIPESKVNSIVELSSQPLAQDAHTECPFCPEKFKSLKKYRRHVGNHQQDLALFVLPKTEDGDENSEESHSLSELDSDDVSLSAQEEEMINVPVENQVSATAAVDGPTEDVQQPRIRNNLDDPLASRTFSVSPTRSFSISSIEECHNDRVPENLDGYLQALRGFTPSPPRSVSSWYDEPVSAEFSEDEVSPINPEKSSHSAVSSTQIRQPFDDDQINRSPQRPLRGTSDNLLDVEIGSTGKLVGDYATSHGIGDGAGNKRRASSPPDDIDSGLEEEYLRQRVPVPKSPINACRNCRRRRIPCLEGGLESNCRHCKQEGLECVMDGIPVSASYKKELALYPENQDASSQSLWPEVPVKAASADNEHIKAKVLYNFAGKATNEITAQNGDLVAIIYQNDEGWSFAKHMLDQEGSGWIPTAYVEPLTTEQLFSHLQSIREEQNKMLSKITASARKHADMAAMFEKEKLKLEKEKETFQKEKDKSLTEQEKFPTEVGNFLIEGEATTKNTGLLEKEIKLSRKRSFRESRRMINRSYDQQERRHHNTPEFTEEFPPDSWEADDSMNAGSANLQRRPQRYDEDDVYKNTEKTNVTGTTNDETPSVNHEGSHAPPSAASRPHDRERNQGHISGVPTSPKGTKRRSKKERKLISKLGFETVECHVPGCEFETDFPNRNDFERHFRAWHPQNEDLIAKLDALTCPNAYCKGMVAYTNESQFRGHMLRVHVIDVKPGGKTSLGKAGASDDNKTIKNRR